MTEDLDFTYRVSFWKTLLAALFFFACGGVLVKMALENDSAIRLFHLITLSPGQATVFLWGIAIATIGMAMFGLVVLVQEGGKTYRVSLTASTITAPFGGLRKHLATVPLSEIESVQKTSTYGQHFLYVKTSRGRLTLSRGEVGAAMFDRFHEALVRKLMMVRTQQGLVHT